MQTLTPEMLRRRVAPQLAEMTALVRRFEHEPQQAARIAAPVDRNFAGAREVDSAIAFLAAHMPKGRYRIYPAGTHAEALLPYLAILPERTLVGFVDRAAKPGAAFHGYPVATPEEAVAEDDFDFCLIAHREFEAPLRRRLLELGVADARILSVFDNPGYLDFTTRERDALQLPDGIETVMVMFQSSSWDIVPSRELVPLFDPATTLLLFVGFPDHAEIHPIYRSIDLNRSSRLLRECLQRLAPRRVYVQTTAQSASPAWGALIRDAVPEAQLILTVYDWAFSFPWTDHLDRYFGYETAEMPAAREAEMFALAQADIVIHKNGGPYWKPFERSFRKRSIQVFPVIGNHAPEALPPQLEAEGPRRVVFGGHLVPPKAVLSPEMRIFDYAKTLAAHPGIECDIFNVLHRSSDEDELFRAYLDNTSNPRVRYHRRVPLEQFKSKLSEFHLGLMPLTFDYPDGRYIDLVGISNRFTTYVVAGLPVILSADDHYMAALVRRFRAGIVVPRDRVDDLAKLVIAADIAELQRGMRRLRDFMIAWNTRSAGRLARMLGGRFL